MSTHFPHRKKIADWYEADSRVLNDVLYAMCRRHPAHHHAKEVWAKVLVIGRVYASGIERLLHGGELTPVVETLLGAARWLDPELAALRKRRDDVRLADLPAIAGLHGKLVALLGAHTRDGNLPRSFVSKYLHFHARCVPIYDGIASRRLHSRGWYPWSQTHGREHPAPVDADERYWRYAVRLAHMADDWRAEGLQPSTRTLDHYLLRYPSEP